MKTIQFTKKIISLSLVTSLCLSPAVAQINLNDVIKNNMSNFTKGSVRNENGVKAYYGASFSFRFQNSVPYRAWFQARGPSVKAGCNGMSFDLGFMSIMNLKEISKQLEQAGTSLLWGIMAGLMYSLPTIGDIFKYINKIVRQIQYLLQNFCSIGKQMGQWAGNKAATKIKDAASDFLGTKDPDSYYSKMNNGLEGAADSFTEWTTNAVNGKWLSGASPTPTQSILNTDIAATLGLGDVQLNNMFELKTTKQGVVTTNLSKLLDKTTFIVTNGTENYPYKRVSPNDITDEFKIKLYLSSVLGLIKVRPEQIISKIEEAQQYAVGLKKAALDGKKDKVKEIIKKLERAKTNLNKDNKVIPIQTDKITISNLVEDLFEYKEDSKELEIQDYKLVLLASPATETNDDKTTIFKNTIIPLNTESKSKKITLKIGKSIKSQLAGGLNRYIKGEKTLKEAGITYPLPGDIMEIIKILRKAYNYKALRNTVESEIESVSLYALKEYEIAILRGLINSLENSQNINISGVNYENYKNLKKEFNSLLSDAYITLNKQVKEKLKVQNNLNTFINDLKKAIKEINAKNSGNIK